MFFILADDESMFYILVDCAGSHRLNGVAGNEWSC